MFKPSILQVKGCVLVNPKKWKCCVDNLYSLEGNFVPVFHLTLSGRKITCCATRKNIENMNFLLILIHFLIDFPNDY